MNLEALSDEEIEGLLGDDATADKRFRSRGRRSLSGACDRTCPEINATLLKQWLANGKASLQPLTFPQRELWEASPVAVTDSANHICCLIHLRGVITQRHARLRFSE